ncbi:MAG: hypothetical protein WD894_16840 [Pirellulales bacterium]
MQFIVPHRDRLPDGAIELAYLAGHEEAPYQTRTSWQGDRLVVQRDEAESATFTIPWMIGDRPPLALSTGTLVERTRPYLLPVELARGTVYRLRTHAFVWQALGLVVPAELSPLLKEALGALARAATSQDQPAAAAESAEQALVVALAGSALLCAAYADQSRRARRTMSKRTPLVVGVPLDDDRSPDQPFAEFLLQACNTLSVPFNWRNVEATAGAPSWQFSDVQIAWCQGHEKRICGGPLLRLERDALPDWIGTATDFGTLQASVARHVQGVVERYRGRVHLWNCGAALNTAATLPLTEEQRLRLAVSAIETVRAADRQTPVILTLDQPWGEALRDERRQLSPIHFADALVRGDLGLAGLGLRVDIGLSRDATLPRDALEISRQIDRWSVFNLPLLIEFTLPPSVSLAHPSEQSWIEQVIPVLLGKPAVQAVFWGRLLDGQGQPFADRGLFDLEGVPKPALRAFSAIRRWAELPDI